MTGELRDVGNDDGLALGGGGAADAASGLDLQAADGADVGESSAPPNGFVGRFTS